MDRLIKALTGYGIRTGLIDPAEEIYSRNLILDLMGEQNYAPPEGPIEEMKLCDILRGLLDIAVARGLIEDTVTDRDLLDTKLMNCLTPRPSEVARQFGARYAKDPEDATDWYYRFSQDTNYIRRDRAKKDVRWKTETPFGELDITINLAKPEKDPKAIAAAGKAKAAGYPACQLCIENEGYAGHAGHPARQNHRILPVTIAGEAWSWQYSPYGYYNEHCIVLNNRHVPMKVDRSCFEKLLSFVRQFPHYFVGSNADLPIVGGSILAHEHFQGGRYDFAMAKAPVEIPYTISGFEDVSAGILRWPLAVLRLCGRDADRLIGAADRVLAAWRGYTDEEAFIYAQTDGEPHNTITPIARRSGEEYQLDLVLRNNLTTKDRPLGLYHPAPELHHIKKENIGLIEVMGLAVLPARLKREMEMLGSLMTAGRREGASDQDIAARIWGTPEISSHGDWAADILSRYDQINTENVQEILRGEIGAVFVKVLEDAGVFKWNEEGHRAFLRFLDTV